MDPKELEEAFALFTAASQQLSASYAELQQKVDQLTEELAIANGHLRREVEEKSALSRRLRLLLDRLPAGVIELSLDGLIQSCNPAARKLLKGLEPGTDWQQLMDEHMSAQAEPSLWAYKKNDEVSYFLQETVAVQEEQVSLVLLHDMTGFHQMRQALERHERLAAMGEMAAGLAHQLRTPLATALLYCGHLARPQLQEHDRTRFATKSLERLRHLEALIQNMLSFVRGNQQETAIIDLADTLQDAIQHVLPLFEQKGIKLNIQGQPTKIRANQKELASAIANLLDNAQLASAPESTVHCTIQPHHEQVLLSITDEGCGMSEQVVAHLFEPFFTTRKDGTGLGLAIVRNLITSYGGTIDVTSVLGAGSTFNIVLPLETATTKV